MAVDKFEHSTPRTLVGGNAIDDRGVVGFVNQFDFSKIKRFYTVSNHRQNFIRAWHAHKHEAKYVFVSAGAAKFGLVQVDDWESPSRDLTIDQFVLTSMKPTILFVPPGYAHGYMTLTNDTNVMFFSTSTLEESMSDDIRYSSRYWDVWTVEER
tara:strand:+ start:74 stop:535 length:462 start_codon:yes stop_codon:yes gene_type:complete